jgi:hypothetical protein
MTTVLLGDLQNAEFNRVRADAVPRLPAPTRRPGYRPLGYDFWLTKLNQFNGNYINAEMVRAFITSISIDNGSDRKTRYRGC